MAWEGKVRRYRAFIAYSHRDRRWARWLQRRLEFYRVPARLVGYETSAGRVPRRLTPIFRDRDELATADDLGESINRALDHSDALIVICSPAAARSKWVNEEVLRFKRSGRAARILCLIVAGVPFAAGDSQSAGEECFPRALRYRLDDRGEIGTEAAEPLAADLRRGGDGRRLALLKLVGGLLGLDLDELRHRDLQRRSRRWAAVTVVAIVVMTVTSLLAVEATLQRNAAERQRAQAESLIAFMLGNLRTELEPIGRLDLLDMIGKRALAYYAAQNPNTLDADSLARRAHALLLIGQVYDLRGKLDDALAAFKEASGTTAKLLAGDPDNPQRIYNHAQSVYWLGYIDWQRGELRQAETKFRLYQSFAQRLVTLDPDKPKWQAELEYSWSNLGTTLLSENKVTEAVGAFRKSLAISTVLARGAPGDTDRQVDVAQSRAWLADTETRLGRLDDAYDQRTRELAIYHELLTRTPGNSSVREALVTSNRALAGLALDRGNQDDALERAKAAVDAAGKLVVQDASNTFWQELDARAHIGLGEILYYRNDSIAASEAADRAEGIALALVERTPTVINWQTILVRAQLLRAMLAARSGDHRGALAIARKSVARLTELPEKDRANEDVIELLVRTRLLEGDELYALGIEGSTTSWKAALEVRGSNDANSRLEIRTAIAKACLRLGRGACANRIIGELDALHYRAPEFLILKRKFSRGPPTMGPTPHSADRGSGPKLQPEENRHE